MSRESLWALLPAYYRQEGGELLERYVGLADALVERLPADRCSMDRARQIVRSIGGPARRRRRRSPERGGTAEALIAWFEDGLPRPRLWPALRVEREKRGLLRFHGSRRPAVVMAWERAELSDTADKPSAVPGSLMPPGLELQAVLLRRFPRWQVPLEGSRLSGELLWEIGPISRNCENEERD